MYWCVLLKDIKQWRQWGLNPQPLGLQTITLPMSHCALNVYMMWYAPEKDYWPRLTPRSFFLVHITSYTFTDIWASARDFQQFDIMTSVDSDEPVHPPFKLRNSKWRSVSSLTIIEYSSDKQRLWSDCAYAQAGLRLCWSHIPNCWKSHALAHFLL